MLGQNPPQALLETFLLQKALITLRLEYNKSAIGVLRRHQGLQRRGHDVLVLPVKALITTLQESISVRESKVTVKIPRPLYRKIQQVVEESGFNSPTDFIVFVLRDLMGEAEASQAAAEAAARAAAETTDQAHEFSQDELDDVKRKLKNLGYL